MAARSEVAQIHDLVRSYFNAVAEGRWDRVVGLFAHDATLTVPIVRPKLGRARIRPFYLDIGERYARYRPTLHLVVASGTMIAGIASATVELNAVTHDERPVRNVAVDKFVIEDGLIRSLRIIFDTAQM